MKKSTIVLLSLLVTLSLPVIVAAQINSAASGGWTDGATWVGGNAPTSTDDVVIQSGHTISIDGTTAVCRNLSFGGDDALIDINPDALFTIYGDFTLFSTTHTVFSPGWSATNAYMKFAGSAVQTLRGFSTTGGSTSLRDVIIDKDGGMVTTDGSGMRLGIQNSLEIVNGLFELAAQDDIEGRWASSGNFTSNPLPNIIVQAGGEFHMDSGDGAHHIRSGYVSATSTHLPIGLVTVYGKATFIDASTYKITLSGIDVESGGKLIVSTDMGGGEFDCGPLHIKEGGELEHYTTSDCWGSSAVLTLDSGGLFDSKASTTLFPVNFTNNGTVRYSREGTTDQTIVDMDYTRLEISLDPLISKIWDLADDRVIADTLKINYEANLVLTAANTQSLTVGSLLYLTSGLLDNSDANASLVMAGGAMIQRATGTITNAPVFAGQVDLRYTSTAAQVTSGPEVPSAAGVLRDFTLSGDQGVILGSNLNVGGVCTISGSDLTTDVYKVILSSAASLVESDGMTVLGTAETTRTAVQFVRQSFGGIGLSITAGGGAPGSTKVVRTTGVSQDINGHNGIQRSFAVTAANNSGLNATAIFHYDDSELNGITENTLSLFAGVGSSWTSLVASHDETANTLTATGIASFTGLTAGRNESSAVGDGLLPVRTGFVSLYPNPFNPLTRIVFDLEKSGPVQVGVYDVRGQKVRTLVSSVMPVGRHNLSWNGLDDAGKAVASGVYMCRLQADGLVRTEKMMLAR